MYAQDSGRRLSEWQASGGSSSVYQNGPESIQNTLGGATWSFGGLPSTMRPHQDQFSPTHRQELARQPPQNYVLKQEYSTPCQEPTRGQHGTPITISSGGSWPREEFQHSRSPQKRAGSPSLMYDGPIKRQQSYISPEMTHPSRLMPENARQIFFENYQHGKQYITDEHIYQMDAPRRMSISPYEQAQPGRSYIDHSAQSQFGDPQQYISPLREQLRVTPASYRPSPEDQFRGRSLQQAPFHSHSSQPILHPPPQQLSAPQPSQHMVTYEQSREHQRAQSQHHRTEPCDMAKQGRFRRAMTAAPENYQQHQNEDGSRNFASHSTSENLAIEKPRPQLGSPLWRNAKVPQKDAPEQAQVLVYGHFVERAGKRPVPEDQIDRGRSDIPFTPPQQRAKSPSVSSQYHSIQRGGSKSVATPTLVNGSQQSQRKKKSYHPPSVEDVPDEESPDGTPLNEFLGRQQRQGHMSRNDFDEDSYRAASILPQDSIFSRERPKAKPPIPQFAAPRKFPASPPDVISLIPTPDTSTRSPPQHITRSVPMKERIAPAKKLPAKKFTTTLKSANPPKKCTPKTPRKQRVKVDEDESLDPAIIKQKRAADLIITKEIKGADEALDLVLFGEVIGQTEEEKQRKEDEMRAESQRKRLAKEAELQAREEAENLAEMERVRVQAEKEEKERLEKEREEDRNRIRREAERKRRDALEERERDELRRKAAEKIEADRKKADEEAEERERLKQKAKEKAEKVQAEAEELAKLKAKQEEAKKQAASLSAGKVPTPDDGGSRTNIDKDEDVVMEEDTLFLPDNPPDSSGMDDLTRAEAVGPSNAAEVFAQSGPKAGISAYRAEKEEAELRRAKLAKESRLSERWKRQEAVKAMQQAPPPQPRPKPVRERLKPSKAHKKECPPPKPKATSVISPPSSDAGSAVGSSISQLPPVCNIISANSSFSSTKSAPAALPPQPPQEYKSTVKLISQLEREKFEREQREKRARENALKKAARTEQQKAERKRKDDEKARVRKKQQLIDDANANGVELSEVDLEAKVEAYMVDRETKRQRRVENQARKDKILDFAPDNLALESFIRPQSEASPAAQEFSGEDEEITVEEQVRRASEAAMKESMRALALQRGGAFARAASKKTVADLQSDSESEEDPDDEPATVNSKKDSSGDGDDKSEASDSETDDDGANSVQNLNPNEHYAQIFPPPPVMSSSFKCRSRFKRQQSEISPSIRDLIDNPIGSEHQVLMLYTVKQELIFNGKDGNDIVLNQFLSRKEANDFAAAKVQEFRQRPTKSISEGIGDDNLYRATVIYDRGDKNQAYVYVTECPMSSGDIADFNPSKIDNYLPEKTYFVIQYISQRKVDEDTGEVHIHHEEPRLLGQFSRLEMANHDACTRLIALLKPKTPRMEYIEQHENLIAKQLREGRETADKERIMFQAEIGPPDEESLQWVTFFKVRMEVHLFEMKGPRN